MFNTFGRLLRITTFGESHGAGVGVVLDGLPAGLELDLEAIQAELDRRRPGQSRITTQRREPDTFEVLSGTVENITTGAPLACFIRNQNARSRDYNHLRQAYRPSHADYTYEAKYGLRDVAGGGRSSARETAARVLAGAVAKQLLAKWNPELRIEAWVDAVHTLHLEQLPERIAFNTEFERATRVPDAQLAETVFDAIDAARKTGDSLGGIVGCRVAGVPAGWGEPIYHKMEAALGAAMLGINATKGFEIGSGFAGTRLTGSAHNDAFYTDDSGAVRTRSNHSGGVQGGITNGMPLVFRVAFKPTATIMRDQESVDRDGKATTVAGKGRHDPCVVPRAVPIVEAMTALVLADFALLQRTRRV